MGKKTTKLSSSRTQNKTTLKPVVTSSADPDDDYTSVISDDEDTAYNPSAVITKGFVIIYNGKYKYIQTMHLTLLISI